MKKSDKKHHKLMIDQRTDGPSNCYTGRPKHSDLHYHLILTAYMILRGINCVDGVEPLMVSYLPKGFPTFTRSEKIFSVGLIAREELLGKLVIRGRQI